MEVSPDNAVKVKPVNKLAILLFCAFCGFTSVWTASFFKFAGEIYQEGDVMEGLGLVLFLVATSGILGLVAIILLNYLLRDFAQLDVVPVFETFQFILPLLGGLLLLDEASSYNPA